MEKGRGFKYYFRRALRRQPRPPESCGTSRSPMESHDIWLPLARSIVLLQIATGSEALIGHTSQGAHDWPGTECLVLPNSVQIARFLGWHQ